MKKLLALCAWLASLVSTTHIVMAQDIPFNILESEALAALASIQEQSIEAQVEYCGYVVWEDGGISTTEVAEGGLDYCDLPQPEYGQEVIASFHTHGGHNIDYHSEVPSDSDVEGDFEDEIYGFVGTPGGRVWVIDPFQEEIFLICGEHCIPQDPEYKASDYPNLPEEFSPESLLEFLEG